MAMAGIKRLQFRKMTLEVATSERMFYRGKAMFSWMEASQNTTNQTSFFVESPPLEK